MQYPSYNWNSDSLIVCHIKWKNVNALSYGFGTNTLQMKKKFALKKYTKHVMIEKTLMNQYKHL